MGLDRRTFLQQAGLALFTWGATETGLAWASNRGLPAPFLAYQQALAEPTNRKLALLVGINHYQHLDPLEGCLVDLELQRELLIHRFGFHPRDILVISDRQATRKNIETAFIEHLSKQAQSEDVVVFHFSGYGGQIKMPLATSFKPDLQSGSQSQQSQAEEAFRLVNSYVPVDGMSSSKKLGAANNILQETLLALAQSLDTSKLTCILDTSFSTTSRSKHGTFKIRSLEKVSEQSSPQELAFLEQLQEGLNRKGLKPRKRLLSLPGVVLSAAHNNQIAAERQWGNLSAGLFTQALTHHLWHLTPSRKVQLTLARTAETVEQVMGKQQQPALNNPDKTAAPYFSLPVELPRAVGIINKVNKGGRLELKLFGLPANIFDHYGIGSWFALAGKDLSDALVPQFQVKTKEDLIANAQPFLAIESLFSGQSVSEVIRILEPNLSLNLALDSELERIERVDATSALTNIAAISSAVVAQEQNADCLLGKVNSQAVGDSDSSSVIFSYGLYTPGGELIQKTTGSPDEAVKVAITRLQPQFNNLLAAKWLSLTNNDFSSGLKTLATLTTGTDKQVSSWDKATLSAENSVPSPKKPLFGSQQISSTDNNIPLIARDAEISLVLNNLHESPLHALVFGVDADYNISALYIPGDVISNNSGKVSLKNITLEAGATSTIPGTENSWKWKVGKNASINTLYIIWSVEPFHETLKALENQQNFKLNQQQVLSITDSLGVIKALMGDLHNASAVSTELLPHDEAYALAVNNWATLNFVYQIA